MSLPICGYHAVPVFCANVTLADALSPCVLGSATPARWRTLGCPSRRRVRTSSASCVPSSSTPRWRGYALDLFLTPHGLAHADRLNRVPRTCDVCAHGRRSRESQNHLCGCALGRSVVRNAAPRISQCHTSAQKSESAVGASSLVQNTTRPSGTTRGWQRPTGRVCGMQGEYGTSTQTVMAAQRGGEAVEWYERFLDASRGGARDWQESHHVIKHSSAVSA